MNSSQTYTIKTVKETTFEPDAYGNVFWSVEIEGIQGNALWKTKSKPDVGPVYGHIEKSQSGKANIFKRDQKPDDYVEPAQPTYTDQLLESPAPVQVDGDVLNALRKLYHHVDERFDELQSIITALNIKDATEPVSEVEDMLNDSKPIDLKSIPF